MKRPRVLLADDHALVVDGLRRILEPECEVVGAVEDGRSLLAGRGTTEPGHHPARYLHAPVEWRGRRPQATRRRAEDGAPMEADYNRFDCFHETTTHPHMKDGAWTRAYAEAWRRFYSLENMKAILSRTHPDRYWDVFYNLFWYKNSVVNEGTHPMLTGFVRLKDRVSRRDCFRQESRLAHLRRRIPEIGKFLQCRWQRKRGPVWRVKRGQLRGYALALSGRGKSEGGRWRLQTGLFSPALASGAR